MQCAEIRKKTAIDYDPANPQAQAYRNLAQALAENEMFVVPKLTILEGIEEILLEDGLMDGVEKDTAA